MTAKNEDPYASYRSKESELLSHLNGCYAAAGVPMRVRIDGLPQFVLAAASRAIRLSTPEKPLTYLEVLEQDRQGVLKSKYPTAECVCYHSAEEYMAGLTVEEKAHLETCDFCQSYLRYFQLNLEDIPVL